MYHLDWMFRGTINFVQRVRYKFSDMIVSGSYSSNLELGTQNKIKINLNILHQNTINFMKIELLLWWIENNQKDIMNNYLNLMNRNNSEIWSGLSNYKQMYRLEINIDLFLLCLLNLILKLCRSLL